MFGIIRFTGGDRYAHAEVPGFSGTVLCHFDELRNVSPRELHFDEVIVGELGQGKTGKAVLKNIRVLTGAEERAARHRVNRSRNTYGRRR